MASAVDYSDDCSPYRMLQHALLWTHAGMNTLHRYYVSSIGYRFANVFDYSWLHGFVFQSLAGLAPPYVADDCSLVSLTDRHLRSADT